MNNVKCLIKSCYVILCIYLSHGVASGSDITPCNKIDKPLVVYRLARNTMTSIICVRDGKTHDVFTQKCDF